MFSKRLFQTIITVIFSCVALLAQAAPSDNPIDSAFPDIAETLSTTTENLAERVSQEQAIAWFSAWRAEATQVAQSGDNAALGGNPNDFIESLHASASQAVKRYPDQKAGALAAAIIYRDAALKTIPRIKNYQWLYPASWKPLVNSVTRCAVMHYDNFSRQPDSWTASCVIADMVMHQNQLPPLVWGTRNDNNTMTFPSEKTSATPEALYKNVFAQGKFPSPAKSMPAVKGSSKAITIKIVEFPISPVCKILKMEHKGNRLILLLDIRVRNNADGSVKKLGKATLTLEKNPLTSSGYTVVSYKPQYKKFK